MLKIRTLLKFKNGLYKSPAFLNNKNFKSFHLQISLNFSEKNNKNKVPEGNFFIIAFIYPIIYIRF